MGFFLVNEGSLIEMSEEAYDTEAFLQRLLEDYPNLLAGGKIDSASPRRWLLLDREMPLASEVLAVEVASMYNFTNRMSLACGKLPNEEYHALFR